MKNDELGQSHLFSSNTNKDKLPDIRADQALKVIFSSDSKSLVKFINSTLNTNYNPENAKVVMANTEFIDGETYDKIIADLKFYINDIEYHIEFQTAYDNSMLIRVMEYSFSSELAKIRLALKNNPNQSKWITHLAQPVIIFLEEDSQAPTEYEWEITVGEQKICGITPRFKIPVIKVWEQSIETLVKKDWFLLLPYLLLRYRKPLAGLRKRKTALIEYKETFREINATIEELYKQNKISKYTYFTLSFATKQLAEYLIERYDSANMDFKEEVVSNMGDYQKNLFDIVQEESEARGEARGIAKGEAIGKIKLLYQDFNMTPQEIAKKLKISKTEVITILKEAEILQS